ncbi:MAG: phosphatase PAP2 family protein, partial [Chloroflexi bacterium]|nr:phosphatase PAP2 family protein [Chloroflexota bacterium]
PMIVMAVCFVLWFLWRRQKAECLVASAALLSLGINPVLKVLIERPRPAEDLIRVWQDNTGLGFPSGHAFTAVVLFGLAFYLAPALVPGRWAIALLRTLSASMILLIGLSRVYLGAHWPSVVLGGFVYGAIVLTLLVLFHGLQRPQAEPARAA